MSEYFLGILFFLIDFGAKSIGIVVAVCRFSLVSSSFARPSLKFSYKVIYGSMYGTQFCTVLEKLRSNGKMGVVFRGTEVNLRGGLIVQVRKATQQIFRYRDV